jgi:hypothetical protein
MSYPENSIVVLDIAGKRARVFCNDAKKEAVLLGAGFAKDGDVFVRPVQDDADRKQLVLLLASHEALFSAGKDWSPAELVAYYKEQGLALGDYRVIAWHAPDRFSIAVHG